ncbi:hypothetical protein M407DRAFT_246553 [Tulasnella calospora MUT 4182]|uniref:Major facilitator superfamily (MFS) profile domain-containing protein n=1 Tax=Tulasnella calospora MUT 4182 TaxID=1051891 RepID=A0A0C3PTQ8_9AGAM|nr:hypothetical protein M407DRAFT_246553 [Tulasnella calospora MUT 4182]
MQEEMSSTTPAETIADSASLKKHADPPADTKEPDPYRVKLEGDEDPKSMHKFKKWMAIVIICSASTCVTCASSVVSFTQKPMQEQWHVSSYVTILGISLFVEGLGIGPLLLGPLSEFYGRNLVYWSSFALFLVLNLPVALAPNIATYLVFRFLTGFAGAAFLSVAGGSVTDLFANEEVLLPMAIYSVSPMIGPVLGPAISGFINQNTHWRWTYWVIVIWAGVELALLVLLVPETYVPTLEARKAKKLRKSTGDERYHSALERSDKGLVNTIALSCLRPFQIMMYEPMALLLNIWSALLLGILYLTFEAFPTRVFGRDRGFNTQMSGLSFVGIGIGMVIAIASQPYWIKVYKEDRIPYWERKMRAERQKCVEEGEKEDKSAWRKHEPEPEARLLIGMVGAVLVTLGLFWFAFTTPHPIHWIVPMLATVPFGLGVIYAFISIWTFLVHAYRPYAASAMAGNSFTRSAFAAAFPLISTPMYARLGVVGATGLLAGLSALMMPLPFVFYHYGKRLRKNSRFAL